MNYWLILQNFAVPIFIMISGALFLNSNKAISYPVLLHKYVRRIFLALLVFGLPMCVAESVFTNGISATSLCEAAKHLVSGHNWGHMWYLYMLIGLYLLTPIVKHFVNEASNREITIALVVLATMSSIMPTIDIHILPLESYMMLPPYLLIYILGYCLCWRVAIPSNSKSRLILWCVAVGCTIGLFAYAKQSVHCNYADPIVIAWASCIFMLTKSYNANWKIANALAPYCFGVYLIHPVFINFGYKVLKMSPNVVTNLPINFALGVAFLLCSLLTSLALRQIPILRKYVL